MLLQEEEVVAAPAKPAFGLFGFGRKPQPVEEEEEEEEEVRLGWHAIAESCRVCG